MTKYYLVGRLSKDSNAGIINELIILNTDFDIYSVNRNVATALGDYKKTTN